MRVLLCLLTLAGLTSSLAPAQITTEVSDLTGTRRIESAAMRPLVADASYPGGGRFRAAWEQSSGGPASWRLSFYGLVEDTTEMYTSSQLRVRADGQSVSPRSVTSDARTLNGSFLEIKRATFTRAGFRTIAEAQDAWVVIGPYRFEMTYPVRNDLRLILERVRSEPANSPRTASSDSTAPSGS